MNYDSLKISYQLILKDKENLFKGTTCGRGICPFGSECCMTCDEKGQLIESGQCESTLNGNPGCPMIDCRPIGMFKVVNQ